MADKQIIVDGVDMSGCIYFKKNNKMPMCRACNSGVGSPYCEYHKDCYYKQLKRKEQECERLEETNNTLTVTREKLLGDLCIVEESLKDYTEHYNRQSEEVDQLKTENEELKSVCDMWMSKCEQETKTSEFFQNRFDDLKRTLIKIKEVAESEIDSKEVMVVQCILNGSVDHKNKVLEQILQKICEAINE